jgi:hypothetical protein
MQKEVSKTVFYPDLNSPSGEYTNNQRSPHQKKFEPRNLNPTIHDHEGQDYRDESYQEWMAQDRLATRGPPPDF